jgi:hypothetical protein
MLQGGSKRAWQDTTEHCPFRTGESPVPTQTTAAQNGGVVEPPCVTTC